MRYGGSGVIFGGLELRRSPEYENFRQLLIAPEDDCKQILSDRFPAPKFIPKFGLPPS